MRQTLILWLIWLCFIGYAFAFAPPNHPDTLALIQDLSTGQWSEINPAIVALFNAMGIWPLIYSALLFADGRGQSLPAWPFAVGSFAFGAFALLPYLALRHPNPTFRREPDRLIRLLDSRWLGWAIAIGTVGLLTYGAIWGDWSDFVQQWQNSRFIHVMSLDFCLLCGLVGTLLGDDMARRSLSDRRLYWAIVLLPLVGVIGYLCTRPSLIPRNTPTTGTSPSEPASQN